MKKTFYWLTLSVLCMGSMVYAAPNGCGPNSGYGREEGNWGGQRGNDSRRGFQTRDNQDENDGYYSQGGARGDNREQGSWNGNRSGDMQNQGREGHREAFRRFLSQVKDLNINIDKGTITITGTVQNQQERQILLQNLNKFLEIAGKINDKLKVNNADQSNQSSDESNDTNGSENTNSPKDNRYSRAYSGKSNNDLAAETSDPITQSDDQIMLNLQKAIKGGMLSKGYDRITFDVSKGKVTLKGSVDDISDKKAILQKVAGIEGINSIDNQIQVQPSASS